MKKIILLSAIASSMLMATNGDIMIGNGAKASGMGGVSIAMSHGAESAYSNPAMLKDVKNSEFSGSVTMFMPDVTFKTTMNPAYTNANSNADQSFIPAFSYAHRNNDHVVWGISLAGTAGMGVDYVGTNTTSGSFDMKTDLAIAKFSVPIAYTANNFTVGVAPVIQYSTLQINSFIPGGASDNPKSSSTGLGMTAGLAYDMGNLTVAAMYQSKIEAEYANNIATQTTSFNLNGGAGIASGDRLDQPAEVGVGIAYKMGKSTFAVDAKRIKYSDTQGYGNFGWEDQNVYALGYQYQASTWALRAGYNYGKSPISEFSDSQTNYDSAVMNFFNLAGFPGIVEEHYTLGGDYALSENLDLSIAAVYTPEVSNSYNIGAFAVANGASVDSVANVTHSQQALTLGATYKF